VKSKLVIVLLSMIFLHIVDDYYLQGVLAKMKQRQWWKDNVSDDKFQKYKYDYIIALIEHAFSWSFMIHLPWMIYSLLGNLNQIIILISIIINTIIHTIVDNEKANKFTINLIVDQLMHLLQILITCFILYGFYNK